MKDQKTFVKLYESFVNIQKQFPSKAKDIVKIYKQICDYDDALMKKMGVNERPADETGMIQFLTNKLKNGDKIYTIEINDVVIGIGEEPQGGTVEMVEWAVESTGMKCRVRTANRGWAVGALLVLTLGVAAAAAVAVGVHNLATKDSDYEIVKEMFGSDIQVEYAATSK